MTKNKNPSTKRAWNSGVSKGQLKALNARIDRSNARYRRLSKTLDSLLILVAKDEKDLIDVLVDNVEEQS